MSAVRIPGNQALPSRASQIVDVPETCKDVIQRHGVPGAFVEFYDDPGQFIETLDVWWSINHYETDCREHGIPINQQLSA
jgi:hypothetical protein